MPTRTPKNAPESLTMEEAHMLAAQIRQATDNNEEATAKLLLLCFALANSEDSESLLTSVEEACALWLPGFDEMRIKDLEAQLATLRGQA
jgi:hypothetical protein